MVKINLFSIYALLLLLSVGLISYLSISHLQSIRKLNESLKDFSDFKSFPSTTYLDLNDPIAMKKIYKKILHYESIERAPVRHLNPIEIKEEKNKFKLRKMAESNEFKEPVSLISPADIKYPWGCYFVFIGLGYEEDEPSLYVYPYPFSHKYNDTKTGVEKTASYGFGAFISTNTEALGDMYGPKTDRPLFLYRAKALSYGDVAILSIQATYGGRIEDLFQDAVDWCTYLKGYIGLNCFENFDLFFEQKMNKPTEFYSSKVNETSINRGDLFIDGVPRFKILIVPDFKLGTDEIIRAKLGDKGKNEIVKFYENGGIIIITGKSGALFEDFGLIQKGTYDRTRLLSINNAERKVGYLGCNYYYKAFDPSVNDFEKRVICMSSFEQRRIGLSTTFKTLKPDKSFESLIEINSTDENLILTSTKDGLVYPLTEEDKQYNPLISFKTNYKNGKLFVLNYNPLFKGTDIAPTFNTLMLSFTKEIFITSKVNVHTLTGEPVLPAGEAGIEISINTTFQNLYDKEINDLKIYCFIPKNITWKTIPDNCVEKSDISSIPKTIKGKISFEMENYYLLCQFGKLDGYEKRQFTNKIEIVNYAVTQLKEKIDILNIIANFIDYNNKEVTIAEYSKADCKSTSIIRAAVNMDPLGEYPIPGKGAYLDNSIKAENKGEGDAFDVEYTGVYPLISPLVDFNIENNISYSLKLYVNYYNSLNFSIPFTDEGEEDFIDTVYLNNKGIVLSADWDSPAKLVKVINTEGEIGQSINIKNMDLTTFILNSTSESFRQINYKNSDRFYRLAGQRLLVFVDDTTPEGAKTLYGDMIPVEIRDPVLKDRAKTELIFIRQDIYFYTNENYINPLGVRDTNDTIIFSIDRFEKYEEKQKKGECEQTEDKIFGKIYEKGYYSSKFSDILKPRIWTNGLFEVCGLTVIDPTKEDQIKKQFGNLDTFKPAHFIFSNPYKQISQPDQLYDFVPVNKHYGYHRDYPEIKFTYVHRCIFIMQNNYCINGGKIIIFLRNFSIENTTQITVSPDQMAVYNITYNNGNITIYFKRGLMPNEKFGKNMNLTINIEGLNSENNEIFTIYIEELKYDFSNSPYYEAYNFIYEEKVTFEYVSAFSFPALHIKTKLERTLNGYETIETFSRIGVYIQELHHREVFSPPEAHYKSFPGITVFHKSLEMASHLGINPVPFNEYLTIAIPYTPSTETTSRFGWRDIWGRVWYQPLRTAYVEFVVIPPHNKNMVATTTFEILRQGKQIMEWPSDENVQVHLHIKLINNYLKYWEPLRCLENRFRYIPKNLTDFYFVGPCQEAHYENSLNEDEIIGDNLFMRDGYYSAYGICYNDDRVIIKGEKISEKDKEKIKNATICQQSNDNQEIKQCMEELKDIPTINKAPENWNITDLWNYSPIVENFYPKGYITNDMWAMNTYEYDDNPMSKGYAHHMDNILPTYDDHIHLNIQNKTMNIISIPIFKGLGYSLNYNQNGEIYYHGKYRKGGWWCDNLQNKDDTLLAGQEKVNTISVDKKEEIIWVEPEDLVGSTRENSTNSVKEMVNIRLKNIYACLFNRKRAQFRKNTTKIYAPVNIVQNNVIPIFVDIRGYDKRLVDYDCKNEQYTPDNIYQVNDNYLITPTDKDYLYFSANLRSGAKESFNVLLNLNYFSKLKYEGIVKINEGARFVYYNPGFSTNSYNIFDSPVSCIKAKRNDIIVQNAVYPSKVKTFNSSIFNLYTFKDEDKINKIWPYEKYYVNSYGFGDISISVAVGGIRNSKPVIQPGGTTYAKITIYNNCGFDLIMKNGAIDFEYKGEKQINAFDIMENFTHTIQDPINYNFFKYTIEEPYSKYITIRPSSHNIDVAPEFFDFGFINVVTIRDGFKGEYNLQINVTNDFPISLRGKPIEIKIGLITSYFKYFPGTSTDPTNVNKYHDYKVIIPSIYIAVPFKGGKYDGKVLYTSAQANLKNFYFYTFPESQIEAKYVDDEFMEKFKIISNIEEPDGELNKLWNSLPGKLEIREEAFSDTYKRIFIESIPKNYPKFPEIRYGQPDKAELKVLVRTFFSQLEWGLKYPTVEIKLQYSNWIERILYAYSNYLPVTVEGPWFDISYSRSLVDYITDDYYIEKEDQELSPAEEGIIKVQFKLENVGNGNANNVKYQILIGQNVTYFGHRKGMDKISEKKDEEGQTLITFDLKTPINSGELFGGIIYLKYNKIINIEDLDTDIIEIIPNELIVAKETSVIIDLTDKEKENEVTQNLKKTLNFAYSKFGKTSVYIDLVVSGKRKDPTLTIKPKIIIGGDNTKDSISLSVNKSDITKYAENETDNNTGPTPIEIYTKGKISNIKDKPNKREMSNKNHVVIYNVYIYTKEGIASNKIYYEQNKIGISTAELVLIILSIIFYSISILMIYLGYMNCKKYKSQENKDNNEMSINFIENE